MANKPRKPTSLPEDDFWMLKAWQAELEAPTYHDMFEKIDERLFEGRHKKKRKVNDF